MFEWVTSPNKLAALGLFKKEIRVDSRSNRISNITDIVWIWHSGMGRGITGDIRFSDGAKVINGDIDKLTSPVPLEKGRYYYWAVWAWDDEGREITHSSKQSYFIIANY